MSNKVSDSDAQKFVLNFFTQINNTLDMKTGGKRKNKRQMSNKRYKNGGAGGDGDDVIDLPVPLNETNTEDILKLKQQIQSDPSLKQNFSIKIIPSHSTSMTDINSDFSQHIKVVLDNIGEKKALEMTPEELQVLSLFINYKSLLSETKEAANSLLQISQMSPSNKLIIEDAGSEENIQMVSSLLENVSGPPDLVDKQVSVIKAITQNTINDFEKLSHSYEITASPEQISSESTSSFLNLFGRLSVLFNLILCYKNRLSTFKTNLKTTNPVIYFIINSLYSCISFVMFCIFKIFLFLINTRFGQCYLIIVFLTLYKNDNKIAVFIANTILQLLRISDDYLGVSEYVNTSIGLLKQKVIDSMPDLLTMSAVQGLLTSTFSSALLSPEVMGNFVSSLTPQLTNQVTQLTNQVIERSLPAITTEMSRGFTQFGPALIDGTVNQFSLVVNKGLNDVIPLFIDGVSTAFTEVITTTGKEVITDVITTTGKEVITDVITTTGKEVFTEAVIEFGKQQSQQQILNSLSTPVVNLGLKMLSFYITGDPNAGNLIANYGGKRTKKNKKSKRTKKTKRFSKTYKNK
jgi:hypothetical protein